MNNYPLFEQYQLIEYQGTNNMIRVLKSKYINHLVSKSQMRINDLEANVKRQKPINLLINKADYPTIIETLNNIKGRKKYYIKCITHSKVEKGKYIPVFKEDHLMLTDEQNEYLLKNFMFEPISLKENHSIKVGQINKEFLKTQFKTDKNINEVSLDYLLGETDNHFHVSYKNKQFFLKKSDKDLEHPVYSLVNNIEFDPSYYNELCQWPEWVENKYELKDHQIYAIKSILYHKKFAIFDRAGTGKTILSIVAALASGADKILIATQLNLKHQWIEFIEYFNQSVSSFHNDIENLDVFAKFHVIHYNQLDEDSKKKKNKYHFCPKYDFKQFNYDFIIADEAHEAKNLTGIRGQHLSKLIDTPHCKYAVPLTASPFENNEQVYNVFHNYSIPANNMIPINEYNWDIKKEKLNDFKIRYCSGQFRKKGDKVFVTTMGDSNTHELAQRLKYSFLCRTSLDIKGFPDLVINDLVFNMDMVSRSEYNRYKKELKEHYAKMKAKNQNMMVNEDLPMFSKIREFLAKKAADQTISLARSLVKEGKKVIIFTHFQSEFDMITQYLPDEAVWVHVTKANRWKRKENVEIINEFKHSESKNIIIGNIKTLGTGQNIPQADVAILNSPNWAYGEHMQSMSRPRRLNRKKPVDVYFWMIRDTEIEKVFEVNERKRKNTNILLGLPEDFY